ncbi:MAG: hypothetical protein ACREO5_07025, partial [Candidatus Binatia bacterium]
AAGSGLYFSSKVTAHNNVFTDVGKNGNSYTTWGDQVYVRDGSGVPTRVDHTMGSVLTAPVNGAAVPNYSAPLPPAPTAYKNANWISGLDFSGQYDGNLLANQQELKLPLKINAQINGKSVDLVELIKRGKSVGDLWNSDSVISPRPTGVPSIVAVSAATKDDGVTASERYYNKPGIRVSLADTQQELPGCAAAITGTTQCGVRLDGNADGMGLQGTGPQGYKPVAMSDGYQATEINGERFRRGTGAVVQAWIKVETVQYDATSQAYITADITRDILSLGVTEPAPAGVIVDPRYAATADSRSVIKLQRYVMPGIAIPQKVAGSYITTVGTNNYVVAATVTAQPATTNCDDVVSKVAVNSGSSVPNNFLTGDSQGHWRRSTTIGASGVAGAVGSKYGCLVAYPINMFDTREGLFNESTGFFDRNTVYGTGVNQKVPWAGVMSMVNIDVKNLQQFLEGNFDSAMPTTTPFATSAGHTLRAKYRDASNNPIATVP